MKHMEGKEEFLHPDSVGADRSHTLKLLCLDRDTGKILWERTAYEGTLYDNRHKKNTYASPTPATDGRHIYAFFGSEGAYCYDFEGNQIWKTMVGKIATLGMGVGTSPVLYENLLILQCDEDNGEASFIMALDKSNGQPAWKTPRKIEVSWSTPIVVRAAQRAELITSGNEMILSYDPVHREGMVALQRTGEQCHRYARCAIRHGLSLRGLSGETDTGDSVGPVRRSDGYAQCRLAL